MTVHSYTEPRLIESLPDDQAQALRAVLAASHRREEEFLQLQQFVATLSRPMDEEATLDAVAHGLSRSLGGDGVVVATVGDAGGLEVRRHVRRGGDGTAMPVALEVGVWSASVAHAGARVFRRREPEERAVLEVSGPPMSRAEEVLVCPMVQGHSLLGMAIAYADRAGFFDEERRPYWSVVSATATNALRQMWLRLDGDLERRQSEALADAARAVGGSLRVTEVQRLIMRHAMSLLRADGACVAIRDGEYLLVESALGVASVLAGVVVPVHGSLSGQVVRSGEPCISNSVPDEREAYRRNLALVQVQRAVIVPLRTARGILGALSVYNRDSMFGEADARVLQRLADQVTVAIVNSRLFTDLQVAMQEWSHTFDALGVGVVVVNDEGRVLRANSRARELLRIESPVGLLGRQFYEALTGDSAPPEGDPLGAALVEGRRCQARCVGARGEPFDVSAAPHFDGGAVLTFDVAPSSDSARRPA